MKIKYLKHCFLLVVIFLLLVFSTSVLYSQSSNSSNTNTENASVLTPGEFVKQVFLNSNENRLVELEAQIANEVRELSKIKLVVPSLDLKVYPFGYDSRRTDTFISEYSFNGTQSSSNPISFSGLRQTGIDNSYYTIGSGLELKTLTPFGGYFGVNVDYFFLINDAFEEYRQRIKFDFILTQPLFVNNLIADLRPFFNEFEILDDKYSLALTERKQKQNVIVKGALQQAYALISLRRQKDILEKTIEVLKNDLDAMEIRKQNNVVSETLVQSLRITLSQKEQQFREVLLVYNDVRWGAERMIAAPRSSLVISEKSPITDSSVLQKSTISKDDIRNNYEVRKSELEYDIASKGIYAKNIESRPLLSFNFSLEPRYPQPRRNSGDFITSFTDFSQPGSTIDFLFTMEFSFPLLTAFEQRRRRTLDSLSVEAARLSYEQKINDTTKKMKEIQERNVDVEKKLVEIQLEIDLQKVFLNEKQIQFEEGDISQQEVLRQELQLMEVENRKWELEKEKFLFYIDILDIKGVNLRAEFN